MAWYRRRSGKTEEPVEATATAADAERFARRAHRGQKDRAGRPYIHHVRRVAEAAGVRGLGEEAVSVAWLHDVLEDTDTAAADLVEAGFGTRIAETVRLLTRDRDTETYAQYIDRVVSSGNLVAKTVKAADISDHLSVTPETLNDGLRRRYAIALDRIENRL